MGKPAFRKKFKKKQPIDTDIDMSLSMMNANKQSAIIKDYYGLAGCPAIYSKSEFYNLLNDPAFNDIE